MKELIKKIIRRILGWYIHPLYHEDERIREEMTGYQEQLGTEREKLEEQGHILRDLSGQIQQMAGMQGCLDQQQMQIEKLETEMPSFQEELLQNAEGIQEQIRQLAELRGQLDQQKMRRDERDLRLEERLNQQQSRIDERDLRLEECLNRQQSQIDEYAGMIQSLKDELLRNTNSMVEQNQQILNIGGQLHEIKCKEALLDNKQSAMVYAYRYLLNREPEDESIVSGNMLDWQHLRKEFMASAEYQLITSTTPREMPYYSLTVAGITYFHAKEDLLMPNGMITSGKSWGEADIQNFIKISDQQHYGGTAPREGLFLDIGGNIGTTSIYCKLKLKPSFRFIAFEPVSETAKLLSANIAVNGAYPDIIVERVALSNQKQERAGMQINHENWGNCSLTADGSSGEEQVIVTTLDSYLEEHQIGYSEIKYSWIDVEGHEPEVLEGAASLYRKSKIPTCLEFNQRVYMERQKYEKMLVLLERYFDSFMVCEQITGENDRLRPISELRMLWEECEHRSCDLILM